MARKLNLTGQKFGMLTVLRESTYKNNTGRSKWLCECECGDKKVISGNNLKAGLTTSCGCKVNNNAKKYYERKKLDHKARIEYRSVIHKSYI